MTNSKTTPIKTYAEIATKLAENVNNPYYEYQIAVGDIEVALRTAYMNGMEDAKA